MVGELFIGILKDKILWVVFLYVQIRHIKEVGETLYLSQVYAYHTNTDLYSNVGIAVLQERYLLQRL